MSALIELAQRCEKAEAGGQRELLEAAFQAIHGEKPPRVHGGSDELTAWLDLHNPFYKMLEAKAYESAALTLVPEGAGRGAFAMSRDSFGRTHCDVWTDAEFNRKRHGSAATPALALTAAALRAHAEKSND